MELPNWGEIIGLLIIVVLGIYVYIEGPDKIDDYDSRDSKTW